MRAATYEIHVRGLIADADLVEFVGMSSRVEDGDTILTGLVADQSALVGLVARVESLGCEVREFYVVPPAGGDEESGRGGRRDRPRS